MSASNRSTNGHRFVFHSPEVAASERHYVSGERGVIPYHPPPPPLCPAVRMTPSSTHPSPISIDGPPIRLSHAGEHRSGQSRYFPEYLPSPPADAEEWDLSASPPPVLSFGPARPPVPVRSPPPQIRQPTPPRSPSPVTKLKAGDTLYWHHLSRHGEIPGVQEDPRARGKGFQQRLSQGVVLKDDGLNDDTSLEVMEVSVVCGR